MENKYNFPLFIKDKFFYNYEEIPSEYKEFLKEISSVDNSEIKIDKKWEINGIVYTRFEDIPIEFQKYLEDQNNNGMPDIFEEKRTDNYQHTIQPKLKETQLYSNKVDIKDNLHKVKYSKKENDSGNYFLVIIVLIIIALLGFFVFKSQT